MKTKIKIILIILAVSFLQVQARCDNYKEIEKENKRVEKLEKQEKALGECLNEVKKTYKNFNIERIKIIAACNVCKEKFKQK